MSEELSGLPTETRKSPRMRMVCHAAAGVVVVAHFVFLMCYFEPAIHQPDANGYFAQATRIARDGRASFVPESHLEYINMHWLKTENGRYYSHYPPGFSLVLALPFKIGGPGAAMAVNPLMSSLTLLGLYLICALWIGPGWGLVAAVLMAFNPTANNWALAYFAHAATAFFLVWAIYFLARWEETLSWKWALAAGAFFGMLPSVRYPAGLFCAAAGVFVLLVMFTRRGAWRSAIVALLAAVVPIAALAIFHQTAFGAFWKTGYSLTREQTGFSWDYFTRHAVSYLENLSGGGAGVLFGVGLAGIAALCVRRQTWKRGVLFVLLVLPVTVLYMSYYWSGGGRAAGTMRFLLPTFYVYAIAGVWLLSMLGEIRRGVSVAAAVVLLAVTACWGVPESVRALDRQQQPAAALASVTDVLREHVESGSLIMAPGHVHQHLDFVGRWRLVDETAMRGGGRVERFLRRRLPAGDDRPSPIQREKIEERIKRYEGLSGIDRTRQFAIDLWKWAGKDRKVYWLVEEERLKDFKDELPWDWPDRFKTVATIELPKVDLRDRRGGRLTLGRAPPGDERPPFAALRGRRMLPGDDRGDAPAQQPRFFARRRRPRGPMRRFGALLSGGKLLLVEWTTR